MDYTNLIVKAIQNNEVANLLRGDVGYEITVSQFTSDVFPTEINEVLVSCFYEQKGKIDQIETIEYDLDKATFFQCGICMDSFHETEKVKMLPCEHIFHIDCMSQWLQTKKNCPFCDQAIFY